MSIFFTIRKISNQTKNQAIVANKGQKTAKKMKSDEG